MNGPVTVLAAASLTDALTELGATYTADTGLQVTFSFGGSGTLATQVRNGAPADAVVFASAGPMDDLQARSLIVDGTRRDIMTNRLVVVVSGRPGVKAASLEDVADKFTGRVAIGETSSVPAGQYAKAALESAGLWDRLQSRLVQQVDVRAVAAAVSSGNAESGFVYATDAGAAPGVEVAFEVPAGSHPAVVYPAAVVATSTRQGAAAAFLAYLGLDEAQAVFKKYGFSPAR